MATSTITNTIKDPSGTAVAAVTVKARLMPGPGFRADATEVARLVSTTSDANGLWSLALERNANISRPADSWWEIEEQIPDASGGPRMWPISVGNSNASLLASLTAPSTDTSLAAYITQAAGDARYLQAGAYTPVSGDGVQLVSTAGNDSNSGLAWGAAKLTLAGAVSALPAGGGKITVGLGTFSASSQVTPISNLIVEGQGKGTVLSFNVADIAIGASNLTNVTFRNLRLTGAYARGLSFTGASTASIRIQNCWIDGATLSNGTTYSAGVYLDQATDVWVEDCEFSSNGIGASANRSADILAYSTGTNTRLNIVGNKCTSTATHFSIAVFNPQSCKIARNHCSGPIADASNNSGYGILLYDGGGNVSSRDVVEGNSVSNTQGIGIYAQGTANTTITGNTVDTCGTVQTDGSLGVGGIVVNTVSGYDHVTVTGNAVSNSGRDGIVTTGNGTRHTITGNSVSGCTQAGIRIRGDNRYCTISGNAVDTCAGGIQVFNTGTIGLDITGNVVTNTTGTTPGIDVTTATTDSVIANNVLHANGGQGIFVSGGARWNITGNNCKNNSVGSAGTYAGIYLSSTDTVCTGNLSLNSGTSNQKYGIQDASAGTSNIVSGNDVSSNVTAGVLNAAATQSFNNALGTGGQWFTGTGAPSNAVGNNGDLYVRTDTPGTGNQRLYMKAAGAWAGVV